MYSQGVPCQAEVAEQSSMNGSNYRIITIKLTSMFSNASSTKYRYLKKIY